MERAICCLKMQRSVSSTQATWIIAPSSERSSTLTQKPSLTVHTLVRLKHTLIVMHIDDIIQADNVHVHFNFPDTLKFCNQDVCRMF